MLCLKCVVLWLKDLKDLKTEEIFSRQLKQMEKEKQELANNMKKQDKKVGGEEEGGCKSACLCIRAGRHASVAHKGLE